jgi:hypothetical protein
MQSLPVQMFKKNRIKEIDRELCDFYPPPEQEYSHRLQRSIVPWDDTQ